MTPPRKPVIGLIGGIGAGKSAAAAAMARRGATVIDADRIGHEALEQPDVKAELVRMWGPNVLKSDGTANRRTIAGIVFPNPTELKRLEALVFPHIGRRVEGEIAAADADPKARFVALDAAVMLEAGWSERCDRIVYVDAPREVRLARLAVRSGWSSAEVAAREASQMSEDEKKARSDAVIRNGGAPEQLQERVDDLLRTWDLLQPEPAPIAGR